MRLALVQCNVRDGDMQANCRKIAAACWNVPQDTLCIAAMDSITGPGVACLLREPNFKAASEAALGYLAEHLPERRPLLCAIPTVGSRLIVDRQIVEIEKCFSWQDRIIGLSMEPDALKTDLSVNLAGRRFSIDNQAEWEMILSGVARQSGVDQVSVNLVGGYGSAIYNGQSFFVKSDGVTCARAKVFAEDILIVDTSGGPNRIEPLCASVQEACWLALNLGLKDFVHKSHGSKVLIGLSGGMDSALVACIACAALGAENVTGVLMPSRFTSRESIDDALELADNLAIRTLTIPIEGIKSAFVKELEQAFSGLPANPKDTTFENLQARIRGVILMALANRSGSLVLNTGNKSEACMGYSTLYGDTVGAISVIGDLFKTQVYTLARWYCDHFPEARIPENIFLKPPSAELALDQKDTDSLPPYEELDPQLKGILKGFEEDSRADYELRQRVKANAFKRRQGPPVLFVSEYRPCGDREA